MEDSKFDVLLRKAAQQATRREALGTLIGGALLLGDRDASEATNEGEHRKHHKQAVVYRSIGIDIDNSASTKPVIINHGQSGLASCCKYRFDGTVAAGERRSFNANTTTGWIFINSRFWFQFTNPPMTPYARVAVYGKFNGRRGGNQCCNVIPNGLTVEEEATFNVNQTRTWSMSESQSFFSVTRLPNTSHLIRFAITLPPNLPNGPA
jgi:hypothetical protein